jgi:hypothetical protein
MQARFTLACLPLPKHHRGCRMTLHLPKSFLLMAPLTALLGGCASVNPGNYPSLERRPIESRANAVASAPTTATIPSVVSATLAEALAALGADADRGEAAFRAALADSRATIAAGRGAAVGSERWALGESALSRVAVARGPTTLALAELDKLAIDADNRDDLTALAAIAGVQGRVLAMVSAQDQALAALGG